MTAHACTTIWLCFAGERQFLHVHKTSQSSDVSQSEVVSDQQFLLSFLGTTTLPGMSGKLIGSIQKVLSSTGYQLRYYGRSADADQVKAGSCAHIASVFAVMLDSHER